VAESDFIKQNLSGLRLGNDYDTGGYLLWDLWPDTKIFIDPRYFPFRSWFVEYCQFIVGKNPAFLEKFPCDVWCLKLDYPVVNDFIRSSDWKLVHYGPSACIFVRQGIDVPQSTLASAALTNIKSLPQTLTVIEFSLKINDIDTARKIITNMKYCRYIPSHRSLVSQIYNSYGSFLLKRNDCREAEEYFVKALRLKPQYADAYSNLGSSFFLQNRADKAVEYYQKAIHIEPNNADFHFNVAVIMRSKGDVENAIRHFRQSLQLKPDQPYAYYFLGHIFFEYGNDEQAIQYYNDALRTKPGFIDALNKLGLLHYRNKNYDNAVSCFMKIVELQPELPTSYYNLACLYARKNDAGMSLHWLKLSVDKGYSNWDNIKNDKDLDNIRGSAEYQNLIKAFN
jgi:tetratricopeptide (TPR) repeat protein